MDKSKGGLGLFLSKIVDCVRTAFRPCAIDDPRGRFFVRAGLRRPARSRAPTVFSVRIKTIRTENTVIDKNKDDMGLLLSKITDCVRTAFHACAIDDPRGRFFVRATS
jgi:hypothetical protein